MNTNPDTNHDTNTDQTFLLAEIKRLLLSAVHSATICWHGCENDENINERLETRKRYLRRSVSMSAGSSPKVGWKWKWSNGVGKSEMSIIWCISITNNVKSNKKKSMKQLKRPNSLISHWFSVEMVHNGPKLCKRKRFFLCCKFSKEKSRYAIWHCISMSAWFCPTTEAKFLRLVGCFKSR